MNYKEREEKEEREKSQSVQLDAEHHKMLCDYCDPRGLKYQATVQKWIKDKTRNRKGKTE